MAADTPTPEEAALVRKCRALLFDHVPASPFLADTAPLGTLKAPVDFDGSNHNLFLDLTNLKPQATSHDILALCEKARAENVAAVCVNSARVALVAENLKDTNIKPICVVGFPLGSTFPDIIAAEARQAIKNGAAEIDMVQNVGLLKEGAYQALFTQIKTVTDAAGDVPVKVILEACKLTDEEVVLASIVAATSGAAFVKTSTGFAMDKLEHLPHTGATIKAVRLMRLAVGDNIGVKASGGIKTPADATALLKNGASRLGASGLNTAENY